MTRLFARVRSQAEAAEVAGAGFGGVAADAPFDAGGLDGLWGAADATRLALHAADGTQSAVAAWRDAVPDGADIEAAAGAGAEGLLLTSAGRLTAAVAAASLATVRGACGKAGLLCGFAGGIEPPDMPRLLAHKPDFLVVGRALRVGGGGELDRRALALFADLATAPSIARSKNSLDIECLDRIFLRDHVRTVEVGAYGAERGRPQRVRFTVEADLAPLGRPVRDMRDVVSYDLFSDAIEQLTQGRHVELLETLAEDLAARLLAHRRIVRVRLVLEKLDVVEPGAVGIAIERSARPR